MREVEQSLQQFSEFLLRGHLVRANAAPYVVSWVRQFLNRPATVDPLVDRVRRFCEDLERVGRQDWQVRQAEHALRIYFVNFLDRTDWRATQVSAAVDGDSRAEPLAALQELRARLRTRHYSLRTESSYVDWVRRFFDYTAERDGPQIGRAHV